MTQARTMFPVRVDGMALSFDTQPVMLDGMQVLFDKTVGLYPVQVEAKEAVRPPATPGTSGVAERSKTSYASSRRAVPRRVVIRKRSKNGHGRRG
jgi:hypothetical protein